MSESILGRVAVLDQTPPSFETYDAIVNQFKDSYKTANEPHSVSLFALVHAGDVYSLFLPEHAVIHMPDLFEKFTPWTVLRFLDRRIFSLVQVAGDGVPNR